MLPSRNFDYYVNAIVDYRTLMAQLSMAQKVKYLDNYEGSVLTLLRCSLRVGHQSNSMVNLYMSLITDTKGIIFKICFMYQTDTFNFINTSILTEQVLKQDHMLIGFWLCWYVHVCPDGYLTKPQTDAAGT